MRNNDVLCTTQNPLQRAFRDCEDALDMTTDQLVMLIALMSGYVVGFIAVLGSFFTVCKKLVKSGIPGRNKITPWSTFKLQSTENSCVSDIANWLNTDTAERKISTISHADDGIVVRYQRNSQNVRFEEKFGLENPLLAARLERKVSENPQPRAKISNTSNSSATTTGSDDCYFTDISPDGGFSQCSVFTTCLWSAT